MWGLEEYEEDGESESEIPEEMKKRIAILLRKIRQTVKKERESSVLQKIELGLMDVWSDIQFSKRTRR